mgnify:CR=1 FL=1
MTGFNLRSLTLTTLIAVSGVEATKSKLNPPPQCPYRFAWENVQLSSRDISPSDAFLFGFNTSSKPSLKCKAFPGESSWPSAQTWAKFNKTLGGALIKTVPLAAACYPEWGEYYNPEECQRVRESWTNPRLHVEDPGSGMFPLYQGRSCLPDGGNCTLGGYASYSVAAANVKQIQLAVNFARNANLRLVVKNTGHDFNAKSVGAGALSVWTHKLNDIQFVEDYKCAHSGYRGPAFKLGSGVLTEQVYAAAEKYGVSVVGGECRVSSLREMLRVSDV